MVLHRMEIGHLDRSLWNHRSHPMLLLLGVWFRWHQQVSIRHLLSSFPALDAEQIKGIERSIVDRGQGTSAGDLPAPGILSILLALAVGQHREQEERRLPGGHQDAIILEVVTLGSLRC